MSKSFTIKKINPLEIYHVRFIDTAEMALTMLRMQEFYECPNFSGKTFGLDDYIAWYCRRNKRAFDYVTDVAGCNVPGDVARDFWNAFNSSADVWPSRREQDLWFALEKAGVRRNSDQFYIIATAQETGNLLGYFGHEIRHALFYLVPAYRTAVLEVIANHRLRTFRNKLLKHGYANHVLDDEIQAYVLTGLEPFYEGPIRNLPPTIQSLRTELKKVERQFIKGGRICLPKE